MKAILVEELQEAMKNALVDAWKEVESLKGEAEANRLVQDTEDYIRASEQRKKAWEMLNETINNS